MESKKTPLDRARIEHVTKYVSANRDRLHDALRALLRDDDGDPLPCIIMMPTGEGCHVLSNMPTETTMGIVRAAAQSLERAAFAKAFANVLTEGVTQMIEDIQLTTPEEAGEDGDKIH